MTRTKSNYAMAVLPLLLVPTAGVAQFRAGEPEVVAPQPQAPDPTKLAAARFDEVYPRASRPRIVVFWNQDLGEDIASEFEDRHSEHEVESTSNNGLDEDTAGPSGSVKRSEGSQLRERRLETTDGIKRVRAPERGHVGTEAVDWQLEDVFNQVLASHGARLVDRKLSIRLTGAQMGAGERANQQEVEMRAMSGYADLIVSVMQTPDQRSPSKVSFRVTATDLRSARVITRFITSAQPRAPRMGFVVGPNGFERATAPEPSPAQIAKQLALETLAALANGLGAAGP